MQRRIGYAVIESIAAASPKFTAPMVMVHGLWCTAAIWRGFMGYLAHRGWCCHAINLRAHADAGAPTAIGKVRLADYVDDVRQVIAACEAPPVLVGHDLGGLLALHRALPPVRAIVALAPLLPRSMAATRSVLLSGFAARLAGLRARVLPVPRGRLAASYFARGVPGGAVSDSGSVAHEMESPDFQFPIRSDVPTLVVVGAGDPFAPGVAVERLARDSGATVHRVASGGHSLPWGPGWEQRVSEIHRWLIQRLGEDLLALREEEDEQDDRN